MTCSATTPGSSTMAEHRRKVLAHFSGTLCVDELHLGRFTLLLATDPLSDLPVAFALVAANDQDHMRRFLRNLKNWGLTPKVVVTDGSNLYPAVLGELWPDADHQLCVFHVIKDINKLVLDGVRRMRSAMSRRGKAGRKKNHVERTNRMFRLLEKVRYRWRRRRTLVRFVVLTLDRIWAEQTTPQVKAASQSRATVPRRTEDETKKQGRVA